MKGKTILKISDPADGLCIVKNGSVGLYFPSNLDITKPDIKLKNDIVGEMGVNDCALRLGKGATNFSVMFIVKKRIIAAYSEI